MVFLLTKRVCCSHRTPDSKIRSPAFRLFGAVGTKNPVGLVATVFPEFIARDGQERADGGRQGNKRRVGAARRRSRGHGPARLDGTWPRATVASKVMESGETAEQATAILCADRMASEARRPGSGSRAGDVSRAERGNDGSPTWGETPQVARCAARQRDRPCFLAGDAQTAILNEHHAQDGPHAQSIEERPLLLELRLVYGRSGASGSAVFEGRQACAAGIGRRAFPWRQAKRAAPRQGREGFRPSRQGAGWIPKPASTAKTSSADSARRARTAPKARQVGRTR